MSIYTGYVYIWYDTRAKMFYIGGHKGPVEDNYICSSKMMLRAYKKRPETFKFRVLQFVEGDNKNLREAEQYWLDKIKDSELYWTPNIRNKSVRYYNMKKTSSGGNGLANKGKKRIGSPNKGKPMSEEQKKKLRGPRGPRKATLKEVSRLKRKCLVCDTVWETNSSSRKIYCSRKCADCTRGGGWNKGLTKLQAPNLSGGRKRRVSVAEYPTNSDSN